MLFYQSVMVIALAGQTVGTQSAEGPARQIGDAIAACRQMPDDAARLSCFDAAATRFVAARDRQEVVLIDREEMRKARRSVFGFALPTLRLLGGSDDREPPIQEIETTLRTARASGHGQWQFTLADDSVWQTQEATSAIAPRPGQKVSVKAGTLGSYFVRLGNGPTTRARRVR